MSHVGSDAIAAVAAARRAFDNGGWTGLTPAERGAFVRRWAAILGERVGELSAAWTAQVGGLASFAPIMHGGGVATLDFIASLGESYPFVERRPSSQVDTAIIVREPVGVTACIAPWNAPFSTMSSKVAYALVAGCTVVMKPSPETPLEAYIMAEAAEAGRAGASLMTAVCRSSAGSMALMRVLFPTPLWPATSVTRPARSFRTASTPAPVRAEVISTR